MIEDGCPEMKMNEPKRRNLESQAFWRYRRSILMMVVVETLPNLFSGLPRGSKEEPLRSLDFHSRGSLISAFMVSKGKD